jgi:hypothetical protein
MYAVSYALDISEVELHSVNFASSLTTVVGEECFAGGYLNTELRII